MHLYYVAQAISVVRWNVDYSDFTIAVTISSKAKHYGTHTVYLRI
jgi:hypothetical protein